MDYQKLADILFPNVTDTPEMLEERFPARNAPEGAVYGYETTDWDGMMARLQMLATDYPIKGLRPIGAAGPRGDGYSAAMLTGQLMARLAIKDLSEEGGNK